MYSSLEMYVVSGLRKSHGLETLGSDSSKLCDGSTVTATPTDQDEDLGL